jgi:vacuolar-type H+-ATPase subunit H
VEQIRSSIPGAILEAEQIIKQRDEMLSQAQREASQITSSADEDYRARVQESHVVKAAEKRAQEILNEAQRQARILLNNAEKQAASRRKDANQYTLDVLRKLDSQLSSLLTSIRKGVAMLEKEEEEDQV